jgi:sodium-dependent dicarboxylate transporter 2/3/5
MSPAEISIIILVICVVLFVTEIIPLPTTAVFGCTAMAAFGVCSFGEAYSGFASNTVMMVIGVIVLGNAMFETGAAQLLGKGIVKLAGDNERNILILSMIAAAVLSAFLSNSATVAMFIAIISGVAATSSKIRRKNLFMPIGMAAVAGGCCTLVGSTPQVVAQGILIDRVGEGFNFFDFALPAVPIVIAMIIYFATIGRYLGIKIWGDRYEEGIEDASKVSQEADVMKAEKDVNMTKIVIVLIIFALTITGFVTGIFQVGLTSMIAALACVMTGCISQKKAFESMDWVAVTVLGGALGIATGLDVSGGGEMIANGFINLVGFEAAPFIIFSAIVFIVMALSQFMSNTATTAMVVPIAIFICRDLGLNPFAFAMGIIIAANMSFSTPVATTPITLTLVGGYKFMDYVKVGGIFNVISYFLVILLVPLFFPLVL